MSAKTCAPFRELMLEADPGELRGEGGGSLARHLATCPQCARVAALVLEETRDLDAFLSAAPTPDVDALLARAGVSAGPDMDRSAEPRSASWPGPRRAPRMRRFPTRRLWIPVAVAAALATLLLVRGPATRAPSSSVAVVQPSPPPVVEPAAGQNAAIIHTDDPEITVIWLFPTG